MDDMIDFVENYHNNRLTFDQENFLSVIDILLKEIENSEHSTELNKKLTKLMDAFEFHDYYLVMQIIEYELIPYFN